MGGMPQAMPAGMPQGMPQARSDGTSAAASLPWTTKILDFPRFLSQSLFEKLEGGYKRLRG